MRPSIKERESGNTWYAIRGASMFLRRGIERAKTWCAVFIFVLACAVIYIENTTTLLGASGRYTYYLYSPSSNAQQTQTLCILDLPFVQGQSVKVEGVTRGEETEFLTAFAEDNQIEWLFTETFEGGVSYYGYTPNVTQKTMIYGQFVNVHLAVSDECVLGSPIIFGGY